MKRECLTPKRADGSGKAMKRIVAYAGLGSLAGCVTVKAPDKPIEINLNINVKQEVVVSLQKDAETFITNNPDLFPK